MHFPLVLLISVSSSLSTICVRLFQTRLQKELRQLQLFQFCYIFLISIAFLVISGFQLPTDPKALLMAFCFGCSTFGACVCGARSYLHGPMSLSSVIISCHVLLPTLSGCITYKETLSPFHILGILLLISTFVLSGTGSKGPKKEIDPIWYFYVLMSFFSNGVSAVLINAYGKQFQGAGNQGYLCVAFLTAAVLLLLFYLLTGRGREKQPIRPLPVFALLVVLAAGGTFSANLVLLYLSGLMPASLLYPLFSGISTLLVCVVSVLVFREPMNVRKLLTILLGLGAVVLLNL